jgi:hypothetical protein
MRNEIERIRIQLEKPMKEKSPEPETTNSDDERLEDARLALYALEKQR